MGRAGWCFALWLAWLGVVTAHPGLVAAQDPADVTRARELFALGVSSYDRGIYFEALRYFQDAYHVRPHPLVRVNIANCFDKLDRPSEAILNFELFLESAAGTPAQQQEVRDALGRLRKRVGRVVLNVSPEGARVLIDGKDERRAPLSDAILLKAGRHQVAVSLEGHETALRVVDIIPEAIAEQTISLTPIGAPLALEIVEPPAATPAPPPVPEVEPTPPAPPEPPPAPVAAPVTPVESLIAREPPPAPEESFGAVPAIVWIAGGATFGSLMAAIVTGQLALSADREFNGDLAAVRNTSLTDPQRASAWAQGINSADRAHNFAVATDVLLSCAVAGAILTTILYLNHTDTADAPQLSASVGTHSARLLLQTRF